MAKYIPVDKLLEEIERSRQDNPYTDPVRKEAYDSDHNHFFTMVALMEAVEIEDGK